MKCQVRSLVTTHVIGGGEKYLLALAEGLGPSFTVLTPSHGVLFQALNEAGAGVRHLDLGEKLRRRNVVANVLLAPVAFSTIVQALACDRGGGLVVHAQYKKEQILGAFAASRLRLPMVWTEHGPLSKEFRDNAIARRAYVSGARRVARIIAVSNATKASLVCAGVPEAKVTVVPIGIDVSRFGQPAGSDERAAFLRQWGFDDISKLVVHVSRFAKDRGQEVAVRAAARLPREYRDSTGFLFVGDGPTLDNVKRQGAALGLGRGVVFCGMRNDVDHILRFADVFLSTSYADGEGLPTRILEAMASGVVVVATDNGGTREVVRDGDTGVLLPKADEDYLVPVLCRLLDDECLARRLAEAGKRLVRSKHAVGDMVARTEELFESVGSSHYGEQRGDA